MTPASRSSPNVLVTGTPGVGKSTLSKKLAEVAGLKWIEVSGFAKENNCLEEDYDAVYDCPVLAEDKLLDIMEDLMTPGGQVIDYHSSDFFPERWFDIVVILRADNTALYDRLTARGYSGKKLEDNIDCEIFGTIAEEAQASYKKEIIYELNNSTNEELEDNLQKICSLIQKWKKSKHEK